VGGTSSSSCFDSNGSQADPQTYDNFWTRHAIVGADCMKNPYHGDYGANPSHDLTGGSGDDWIQGTNASETIYGGGGDDLIQGGGGNDTIIGGPGRDALNGEGGDDLVIGDKAALNTGNVDQTGSRDCLNAGTGADTLVGDDYAESGDATGTPGQDILMGSTSAPDKDFLVGDNMVNSGNHRAAGGAGSDWLAGSSGTDTVIGDNYSRAGDATGGATDSVNLGPGNDVGVGDSDAGGNGHDAEGIGNDSGSNVIFMDWIHQLYPGKPDIVAEYDGGLNGSTGDDELWGDNRGRNGADYNLQGGGDDDLNGGSDNNTCHPGPGNNTTQNCNNLD
ncbi:MAG: calcium-binding protein, partial [bacterium]